jgi:peptidoglycan glycosyltransferase
MRGKLRAGGVSTVGTGSDNRRPNWMPASVAVPALLVMVAAASIAIPRTSREALAADPQRGISDLNRVGRVEQASARNTGLLANARDFALTEVSGERIQPSRLYFSQEQLARMGRVRLASNGSGGLALESTPTFRNRIADRFVDRTEGSNFVFYTIDPKLQLFVENLISNARAKHSAVVAMNPRTGAVLAIAGKSPTISNVEYHAGFPAASLFKVVTAAAAVERAGIHPQSLIRFRGGNYTLNEANYLPNARLDKRTMSVAEAMGRSCNPVFGHIGSRFLDGSVLSRYAKMFGFNKDLGLEVRLPTSDAHIPRSDQYELSRTAAGFGAVHISPVHAAAFMSGVANGGLLPKPRMVDRIVSPDGAVLHRSNPEMLQRIVASSTASSLMEMMEYTTTIGTSRREFQAATNTPTLGGIRVAAKTGTLKGHNPQGLNNWFIAAAPLENPELAIAVITVDAAYSSKASHLGRRVFENFFNITPVKTTHHAPQRTKVVRVKKPISRTKYRSVYAAKKGKSSTSASKSSRGSKAKKK